MSHTKFRPLNKSLYGRLERTFGRVIVAHRGEAFSSERLSQSDAFSFLHAGESYRIACPFCEDPNFRLWINHRWGIPDDAGEEHWDWAACFGDARCLDDAANRTAMRRLTYKGVSRKARDKLKIRRGLLPLTRCREIGPSQYTTPLSELPVSHPALQALFARGLDPANLERRYGVSYATKSLCVPTFIEGRLVHHSYFYLDEGAEWRRSRMELDPHRPEHSVLYSFDTASENEWGILVEYVQDVWRMGDHSVALLSSQLSHLHVERILTAWQALVVLFDNEEAYFRSEDAFAELRRHIPVIRVDVLEGVRIDLNDDRIADAIYSASADRGIDLLSLRAPELEPVVFTPAMPAQDETQLAQLQREGIQ